MVDKRMEWGMANSGNVFHRAVTCMMVRWVEKVLLEEWVPIIRCQDHEAVDEGAHREGA